LRDGRKVRVPSEDEGGAVVGVEVREAADRGGRARHQTKPHHGSSAYRGGRADSASRAASTTAALSSRASRTSSAGALSVATARLYFLITARSTRRTSAATSLSSS